MAASAFLEPVLDLLFPPRCPRCRVLAWEAGSEGLCPGCADGLPLPAARCPRCGRLSGEHAAVDPCPGCRDEDPGVDGVVAAFPYVGVPRDLVVALKFAGRRGAALPLASALASALEEAGVPGDLVVPVPLSGRRRRRRGYNQAEAIARGVARRLRLDLAPRGLRRIRDTPPQTGRSRAGRLGGPLGAFRARRAVVAGRCLLLVDDVLTTGGTVRAAARALRRAGVASVVAAVACRTESGRVWA